MDPLAAYLPADRLRAMARGEALPERTSGAALFADISGFTPLAEALARTLGPRRGAEELTRQLNLVHDALIRQVDRFGGSVVSFGGDAITCWFDDDGPAAGPPEPPGPPAQDASLPPHGSAARRAVACAVELHGAMAAYAAAPLPSGGKVTLAVKVAVAAGATRRFVVGDPALQLIDVLGGAALDRMSAAEGLAHRAELVLSPECLAPLGDAALVIEWRGLPGDPDGPRFPVVGGLLSPVPEHPWPPLPPGALGATELRPWLLGAVYESLQAGHGQQLTELRQAVALLLRFGKIDFDHDADAAAKLDAYVRWVQRVLARYGGSLVQLSVGDKGSYLYGVFGAPAAHEDDARRAVAAALDLRSPPAELRFITRTQIGIAQGVMRAGAYGGATRRTYGVIGDSVNLAARLMQLARPGDVLAAEGVRLATGDAFVWELTPPVRVKGRREPVSPVRLLGERLAAPPRPVWAGPLVGRRDELFALRRWAEPLAAGAPAGTVLIFGEPGIGKSRLAEELRRSLGATWITAPTDALVRRPLQPLRVALRTLLGLDETPAEDDRRERLDAALNDLAAALDPEQHMLAAELDRGRATLAALLDMAGGAALHDSGATTLASAAPAVAALLRAAARGRPLVLHVEDAAALDDETHALIGAALRGAGGSPVGVVVTSRYHDDGRRPVFDLGDGPVELLELGPLSHEGTRALAAAVLGGAVEDDLAEFLATRTGGNPFFVEQLALDLRERGAVAVHAPSGAGSEADRTLARYLSLADQYRADDVPASVSAVLVSRLDRLPTRLRAVVQSASVLGPEFDPLVLARLMAGLPDLPAALVRLAAEGIWLAMPGGHYRFRHVLLRDAAYGMQLGARLRELHGQAGAAIEAVHGEDIAPHVATLAHHWREAGDAERERRFLALLGDQAYNISAFGEARAAYERCLVLLPQRAGPAAQQERGRLLARLGRTELRLGDAAAAERLQHESLALVEAAGDHGAAALALAELGAMAERRGDYQAALAHFERALDQWRAAGDRGGAGRALNRLGGLYILLGDADRALAYYEQALSIGRAPEAPAAP